MHPQAVRQFGSPMPESGPESSAAEASSTIGQRLWGDVHTINYQLISTADLPRLSEGEASKPDSRSTGLGAATTHVATRQVSVLAYDANPIGSRLASTLPEALQASGPSGSLLHLLWLLEVSLLRDLKLPHCLRSCWS